MSEDLVTKPSHKEMQEIAERAVDMLSEYEWAVKRLPQVEEDRNAHRDACRRALDVLRSDNSNDYRAGVAERILREIVEGK